MVPHPAVLWGGRCRVHGGDRGAAGTAGAVEVHHIPWRLGVACRAADNTSEQAKKIGE